MPGNSSFLNSTLNDFNFSPPLLLFRWAESRQITSLQGTGFLGCITVISEVQPVSAAPVATSFRNKFLCPQKPVLPPTLKLFEIMPHTSQISTCERGLWHHLAQKRSLHKRLEALLNCLDLLSDSKWMKFDQDKGRPKILSIFSPFDGSRNSLQIKKLPSLFMVSLSKAGN